jgi:Rrf2 family protein
MRISAKGRYSLAALIEIARQTRVGELSSVYSISEHLGISKLFLEQAAAQLKKGEIIKSTKGARGGYYLARDAKSITILDVLKTVETTLFEKSDPTVEERAPTTEAALREKVFTSLDNAIEGCLSSVTLEELLDCADQQNDIQAFMLNM